ncbi:MAG: DNA-formamidopyrimidine glycosylase family protein [Xanthomonadales bacterium]|nr:DNA-formamidopyrimidine glycosylase family protein [Xanthomonadales bacterium]
MPEGDTIHKIAAFLKPRLETRQVTGLRISGNAGRHCVGSRITEVAARGKHLFIQLDNRLALRSHLGMHGSWHWYPQGEPWRKPRARASLVLDTDDGCSYVCFNAREVELVAAPSVRERVLDSRLGPDLTAGDIDPAQIAIRARQMLEPDTPVADVLLDQRVASGIGNVYKSELLFICRHLPETGLGQLADSDLERLYCKASELLGSNLGGGKRVTRFESDGAGRLWVYRRAGLPCMRCDDKISYTRMGRHHRSTYWCPSCQL